MFIFLSLPQILLDKNLVHTASKSLDKLAQHARFFPTQDEVGEPQSHSFLYNGQKMRPVDTVIVNYNASGR